MKRIWILIIVIILILLAGCSRRVVYLLPEIPQVQPVLRQLMNSQAVYGIIVQNSKGDTLLAYNQEKLLVPASTQKLVTASAAWKFLGPDYQMPTYISYDGFTHNNILFGNLVVTGTGDPSLDSRHWLNPQTVFRSWADSLRAHGISEIRGDIIGNDDLFENMHLGSGWAWDDLSFSYAAEFGPLMADNSTAEFVITPPASKEDNVTIIDNLPFDYFRYNQTITFDDSLSEHIHARRWYGQNILSFYGNYGSQRQSYNKLLTVPNPTLFYVSLLHSTLVMAGITISGQPRDIDDLTGKPQNLQPVFTHNSPPLKLIIRQFLQYSNNQAGEALLRHLAWKETGFGSFKNGIMIIEVMLDTIGFKRSQYRIADASGLSRYNLLPAALLNKLLIYMQNEPEFINCLSIPGCNGTMKNRSRLCELDLLAKTGTMSNIECLSGYLTTKSNKKLVVTVMINNFAAGINNHPADDFLILFSNF